MNAPQAPGKGEATEKLRLHEVGFSRMRGASFTVVALSFGLLCAPLILSNSSMVAMASDEKAFHLPAVRQIRAHWPRLDLDRDALSAISPGYHYVLAGLSFITGDGQLPLRLVTWCISLALLWLLWLLFPACCRELAVAALLPLAFSNFFIKSAAWVMTDNPALFCVAATLAMCFGCFNNKRSIWISAALASIATFFRQMNVWTALPVACQTFSHETKSKRYLAIIASLLPVAVVGVLVRHWHGVVPPAWQNRALQGEQASAAALCYILSVFFMFGISYWLAIPSENRCSEILSRWSLIGGTTGLLLALISRTDYNFEAGRWGGYLWQAAARLPVLSGRSVIFLALAPCGGALLAVMTSTLVRRVGRQRVLLWFATYVAWAATFLPNRQIFHRYYEPNTLVFLIFWLLLFLQSSPNTGAKRPWPLLALGAIQLFATLLIVYPETYGRSLFPTH